MAVCGRDVSGEGDYKMLHLHRTAVCGLLFVFEDSLVWCTVWTCWGKVTIAATHHGAAFELCVLYVVRLGRQHGVHCRSSRVEEKLCEALVCPTLRRILVLTLGRHRSGQISGSVHATLVSNTLPCSSSSSLNHKSPVNPMPEEISASREEVVVSGKRMTGSDCIERAHSV